MMGPGLRRDDELAVGNRPFDGAEADLGRRFSRSKPERARTRNA
jgi:hypothetical protein